MKLSNHFFRLECGAEVRDELRNHLDQARDIVFIFEPILSNDFFKVVSAITWKLQLLVLYHNLGLL